MYVASKSSHYLPCRNFHHNTSLTYIKVLNTTLVSVDQNNGGETTKINIKKYSISLRRLWAHSS